MANDKPVGVAFSDPALVAGWSIDGVAVTATAAQLNTNTGVTAGTVTASKAVVVDSNKDISAFRNVTATNLDAGASGTAGSVDIFPTTASKGKVAITKTANTNDDTTSLVFGAHSAARTITVPDPGAAANVLLTTGTATATSATTADLSTLALNAASVTMTTTPASGTCAVQFTVKDSAAVAVATARGLVGYLSDANGVPVGAGTSVVTLTNGTIITLVTGQVALGISSAAGLLGMTLTHSAGTYYWTWILPSGKLSVSTAIVVN